ncbi:hypothetical protein QCM77_04530 [Bradyrhizobium sp. SSUT18]|uniref:hypothetical protein n=1 Tax=Bradyrhizobium sp. SSUT18 TaxID=3040602 RepID=UPI0024485994|nr:hypothetical protein [Bradyrhizobium sp. SSUT18]MDH2399217.1 hypothetical protein [Bradyrhizobium sp. SSUT18]
MVDESLMHAPGGCPLPDRQRPDGLCKHMERFYLETLFAPLRHEHRALGSDKIAQIEVLDEFHGLLIGVRGGHVKLDTFVVVNEIGEGARTEMAESEKPAGEAQLGRIGDEIVGVE